MHATGNTANRTGSCCTPEIDSSSYTTTLAFTFYTTQPTVLCGTTNVIYATANIMKIVSTIATGSLPFEVTSAILGGEVIPSGKKAYTAALRKSINNSSCCAGAPLSAICDKEGINYISVGSYNVNGTDDGNGDPINIKLNCTKPCGWGITGYQDEHYSFELKAAAFRPWDTKSCIDVFTELFYPSQLCAGGVLNKSTAFGDMGDPIIKENEEGDTNDALIGVCTEGDRCGPDCPNVFSRVTTVLPRINSIINGKQRS